MNKAGKWIAFIGLIAACFMAAYEKFKEEWEHFKINFPDEPGMEEVDTLENEPIQNLAVPSVVDKPMNEAIQGFEAQKDLDDE